MLCLWPTHHRIWRRPHHHTNWLEPLAVLTNLWRRFCTPFDILKVSSRRWTDQSCKMSGAWNWMPPVFGKFMLDRRVWNTKPLLKVGDTKIGTGIFLSTSCRTFEPSDAAREVRISSFFALATCVWRLSLQNLQSRALRLLILKWLGMPFFQHSFSFYIQHPILLPNQCWYVSETPVSCNDMWSIICAQAPCHPAKRCWSRKSWIASQRRTDVELRASLMVPMHTKLQPRNLPPPGSLDSSKWSTPCLNLQKQFESETMWGKLGLSSVTGYGKTSRNQSPNQSTVDHVMVT